MAWVFLISETGSIVGGTVISLLLAVAVGGSLAVLRTLGFDREHPWVQRMRTRPWRNGQDVLRLGLRHLPEVLIITPNQSRVAPNSVELQMSPEDLFSLAESLDLEFINSSATECYETMLRKRSVRPALPGPVQVTVVGDPSVPAGRFRLRQAQPANSPASADRDMFLDYGWPPRDPDAAAAAAATRMSTLKEPASLPALRLITGGQVVETHVSGARAGRSRKLELCLPADPTISRVHAQFTFDEGRWWITNLGRNGVTLNGQAVLSTHVVHSGDSIRWGRRADAPASTVEIDSLWEAA